MSFYITAARRANLPSTWLKLKPKHHLSSLQQFSTTTITRGLFKDYVASLKSGSGITEIQPSELMDIMTDDPVHGAPADFHLLDVRETYEWNEDHIPYATYTGRGNLERDIEGIVPNVNDKIVLYCAGGVRSVIAAANLKEMGYKHVSSLIGGIGGWKRSGFPIVTNFQTYSERNTSYGKTDSSR